MLALALAAESLESLIRSLLREVAFDDRPLRAAIAALDERGDGPEAEQAGTLLRHALQTGLFNHSNRHR